MFDQTFRLPKMKAEPFSTVGKIIGDFNIIFYVCFLCHSLWSYYYFLTHYRQISVDE